MVLRVLRTFRVTLTAALVLSSAGAALADVNQLHPNMPRPLAMGGAFTAMSGDASALYYNPAGLANVDGNLATVAFFLAFPSFSAQSPASDLSAIEPPTDNGYGLHFAWSPKDLLDGNLGLGFSVLLPHRRALRFSVHRFEQPYFLLYENAIDLLEIRLGVAYKIFDWVSIGASGLLLAGLDGNVNLDAPFQIRSASGGLNEEIRTVLTMETFLPNREFFVLGAQFYPIEGLTLGVSYREATFVPIRLPLTFNLTLPGGLALATVANLDVKPKYSPEMLAFGGAYQLTDTLLLSGDLVFARYEKYEVPFGNVDLNNQTDPNIVLLGPRQPNMSLRNVWIPKVGAEWIAGSGLILRGGYYYFRNFIRRSDAPILDSDKHALSAGADYDIGQFFLNQDEHALKLQAAGQLVWWTPNETAGFDHSGAVFATNFGAEFHY